ncbi:MAG: hypothetical protein ACU84Q_12885 [Gammaproteobacteria bacterium]
MDWLKIGSAVLLVAMIIYIWPSAKHMVQNSPKAEGGDWQSAILALLAVAGFVALLIYLV